MSGMTELPKVTKFYDNDGYVCEPGVKVKFALFTDYDALRAAAEREINNLRAELAAERKRGEDARAVAVEDVAKAVVDYVYTVDGKINLDELDIAIRALATVPAGHCVVPVEMLEWFAKQQPPHDYACKECVSNSSNLIPGWQCHVHKLRSVLTAARKP